MYSVVLMAAISTGPNGVGADTPAAPVVVAPVVAGCSGCYGCTGAYAGCIAVPAACYGCSGSYASCYGCGGCYGASCHGVRHHCSFLGLCHHHKAKASCHGCTGYSCTGYQCFGSCHGVYAGCSGCTGACYGCMGACYGCGGACYGTYSYPSYSSSPPVMVVPEATPAAKPAAKPEGKPEVKPGGGGAANLKFQLPADAKLYVDGRAANGVGSERSFFTPPLQAGQKYFYEVRAELMVDGVMVTEEKRVIVEAGAEVVESFAKLFAAKNTTGNGIASK